MARSITTHDVIRFRTRPEVQPIVTGHRKIYLSRCGRYRLVKTFCAYSGIPAVWWAERRIATDAWEVLGRHRKRGPAESAIRRHARRHAQLTEPPR